MNNLNYIRISSIENVLEANLLRGILAEKNIPCLIKSNRDSAYNGLFQVQKGWGALYALPEDAKEIGKILDDIRK